jgi:hypothetical protein
MWTANVLVEDTELGWQLISWQRSTIDTSFKHRFDATVRDGTTGQSSLACGF